MKRDVRYLSPVSGRSDAWVACSVWWPVVICTYIYISTELSSVGQATSLSECRRTGRRPSTGERLPHLTRALCLHSPQSSARYEHQLNIRVLSPQGVSQRATVSLHQPRATTRHRYRNCGSYRCSLY